MSRTDRAGLLLHVGRSTAFDALVDPDALSSWLPPAGMSGRFEHADLREGGSYRMVLTYQDPSQAPGKTSAGEDVVQARIPRIVPGEQVVHEIEFESDDPAFHGTMRMEWNLHGTPDGTFVEIVARDVPEGITARDHAAGLTASLANLAAFLEP